MQLRSLTLQAIGPFKDAFTIDFARLAEGGLFLLEGPTGAGKSTIIDAIVFALYGKVASAGASDDRLRSTHVRAELESYVDLVLEVPAGVYRVRRSPAYDRPKQRGTGTTRQQTKVNLWQLSAADAEALDTSEDPGNQAPGYLLSSRADEVGDAITQILGLSREQFVQTIVLPQGEFASFLRAKPEDRSALLQRVFGTEIYQRIQNELVEARKEADRRVAAAEHSIGRAAATFIEAARLEPEEAEVVAGLAGSVVGAEELTTTLDGHLSTLNAEHERLTAGCARSTAAHADASERHAAATTTHRLVVARHELHARRDELAAGAAEHALRVQRLDAARRAAAVLPRLDELELATGNLAKAATTLDNALADAHEHPVLHAWLAGTGPDADDGAPRGGGTDDDSLVPFTPSDATLRYEIDARRARDGELRHLVTIERDLVGRAAALDVRDLAVDRLRQDHTASLAALTDRPAERDALAAQVKDATVTAALVDARRAALTSAEQRLAAARAVDALAPRIAAADTIVSEAAQTALAAVELEARLRRARIDGIAGELATQLVPGEPCAVCGGTEHPHPAAVSDDHVSPEQVDAAATERETAERALADARDARARLDAELARLRSAAQDATIVDALAAVETARDALVEAEGAVARLATLTATIEKHDAETTRMRADVAALESRIAAESAANAEMRTVLEQDRDTVRRAREAAETDHLTRGARGDDDAATNLSDRDLDRDGDVTLAHVRSDLEQQTRLLEHLLDASAEHRRAHETHARLSTAARTALDQEQLDSADAARAAALDKNEHERLAAQVAERENAQAAVRDGLARPEIATLPPDLSPDATADVVAQAEAILAATAQALEHDKRLVALTEETLARARKAAAGVRAALDASRAERDALAPVIRMANLASAATADNSAALTLSTYVLARRFDDVLAAANDRLRQMSSGRYEVQRSTEKESRGGRRLGLSLRIVDHTTETAREPATLSGGETFYVSLCLALGLADVVTAESGGIDLGTLFVDEGFGSLDPATLDLVMAELGKLRAGGRTVGVVSHVEAMKSAIADRISVRRTPDGSSRITVLAGA
ncbi:SMC family ATPase [Sanguibacter hominis ATCC BAA-789]|uniref:Nuclease SbcCD subunit C n=1 Tax=Sanguibacter hominis ATCC BAA-789 TaxID=1312740 RepID=A0A9X5FAQ3_9MICO|nr:SMC family ATPase [Sanguibacter hominis]NKX92665.1 SMC family ATPase [Sanguibacter hominis ATCC BAA-789]